jgi:hypothetical protein
MLKPAADRRAICFLLNLSRHFTGVTYAVGRQFSPELKLAMAGCARQTKAARADYQSARNALYTG